MKDEKLKKEEARKRKLAQIRRKEEEKRTEELASKLGYAYLDLSIAPVDIQALKIIPEEKAKEAKIAVIQKKRSAFQIALNNPENTKTKEILKEFKNKKFSLKIYVVSLSSLEKAWEGYKLIKKKEKEITGELEITTEGLTQLQEEIKTIKDVQKKLAKASQLTVTQILETVLAGALKMESSDVHLEAEEERARLRYRIDGILQDITFLPLNFHSPILSRIKILSGLKLNVHNVAQDGRFSITIDKTEIEVRVSVIPAEYGENITLRILDPKMIALKLEDLGIQKYDYEVILRELKRPNGMIITTGPTGSGKTTLLYAFVKKANKPEIKIITIENPIEYHLKGIEQTQVNPEKGYTFALGLRSILRQDPDMILVGEIRDNETAEVAIHAALTGHLVFSTLHTNDAAGAVPRLVDMAVNPNLIPPALNLVIAQRLVRRVCKNCAEEYKADKATIGGLKENLKTLPKKIKYPSLDKGIVLSKAGKGCGKCNFSGYKGRIGVFELFIIDAEMEKTIIKTPSIAEIRETGIKAGMVTMKQDGILKLLDKITTIEEMERVLGGL